jgi:Sec-independent protein translocase protein TatA
MPDEKRTQRVSLGCGTLILIALIVLIFSGGTDDVEREVQGLRSEVIELKRAVAAQTAELKLLQQKLDRQQGAAADK